MQGRMSRLDEKIKKYIYKQMSTLSALSDYQRTYFYRIEIKCLQNAPAMKRNTYYFRSFLSFVTIECFCFRMLKTYK